MFQHATPWKIDVEPTNHPFRKENDLPNLHDYVHVNLQGGISVYWRVVQFISHLFVAMGFKQISVGDHPVISENQHTSPPKMDECPLLQRTSWKGNLCTLP